MTRGKEPSIMDKNDSYKKVRTAIVLPTLCRNKHLEKCLNSLMKNPCAQYVDLYIGIDYPANDSHWPGYREILKLMERDFSMFRSFHLFKRMTNYGPDKNTDALFQEVIKEHEQFIYLEDDTEFSENYLEYMLKVFDYFRDDPDVISVTGYAFPVKFTPEDNCNTITQNAICSTWGIGFWTNKYKLLKKEIEEELCLIRDFSYNISHFEFSRYRRTDYINCVAGVDPDDKDVYSLCPMFTSITDIAMGVYMQVKGKYQAMPVISKVRNNGFDGTGVYCQAVKPTRFGKKTSDTYDYSRQTIDQSNDFNLHYDGGKSRSISFHILDQFVKPSADMIIKSGVKMIFYRIFGKRKLNILRIYHSILKQ